MSATIQTTASAQKRQAKKKTISNDSISLSDDSESFGSLLGKRVTNETSVDQLRADSDDSDNSNDQDLGGDSDLPEKRVRRYGNPSDLPQCRLLQNRKSAKKCRLKKKAEFDCIKTEVSALHEANKILKEKVSFVPFFITSLS